MNWLQRLVGVKSDEEITEVVERQPTVKEARRALQRVDRILEELEVIELKAVPAKRTGQLRV